MIVWPCVSSIAAEFIFPESKKPAVADHINSELPEQIEAAYATAIQSDWAAKGPWQSSIITGIIAAAAGPALKIPAISETMTIMDIISNLGFCILF